MNKKTNKYVGSENFQQTNDPKHQHVNVAVSVDGRVRAGAHEHTRSVADGAPHMVIRGESITPPIASNPHAALIDWLNFTFPFKYDALSFIQLDKELHNAFGFSSSSSRNKGHLGYSDSWDLVNEYGIIATGGQSQGNTCLVSLNGKGCCSVKNWQAVYDLIKQLNAKITRVDLAHDDFQGEYILKPGLKC